MKELHREWQKQSAQGLTQLGFSKWLEEWIESATNRN